MKLKAKSIIISRKKLKDRKENEFPVVTIAFFNENNPHLKGRVPSKIIDFKNIEKVRIQDLVNISFYLGGGDLVINNLKQVTVEQQDKNIILVTGIQTL